MAPALAQSALPSPEKEIPGTGQTIGDLTTAGYSQEEINELLSQEVVPGSGITIADAMREGWSDTDVGNYIATSEPAYSDLLDASMSVEGELQVDNAPKSSFFRRDTVFDPWFAWKGEVRRKYGFNFGGSWGVLWQNYTNSRVGQPNAVGSKLTLNFSQDLLNRNQPDALAFDLAVEDRAPLGTNLAPLQAGIAAGSIVPTAATWGNFSIGITQAYIRQSLFSNRFQYTIGKVFAPNFIDAYPFFDDNRQFLSQAFSTSPTIPSPLRGFGMVAAWFPTESGLYLKAGMFTSNSSDTGSTISDFFTQNEHFYMVEGGLSGVARAGLPIQARGPMDANNVHLTGWYRDAKPGEPRSYGVAFNANRMYGSHVMWFARSGWSVGWLSNWAASAGLGWRPSKTSSDLLGAGFGWARPTNSFQFRNLHSQYTAEIFYRFQVTRNFAITADEQLVLQPALNPTVSTIWVFSLRGRVTF